MNFERKTSQKQDRKLEKICQKFSSLRQFPSWLFATNHISKQFPCNKIVIFNNTEPLLLDFGSIDTHAFLVLQDDAKPW